MKIVSSYTVEMKNVNKIFRNTIKIYKSAVTFCIRTFETEWDVLKTLDAGNKQRFSYADNLIHNTKSNVAKYPEFDTTFRKLPSFLRFAVINEALGYLSSYHSNLDNWICNGCIGNKPLLQTHQNKLPTFYRKNMYRELKFSTDDCNSDELQLKLFVNNDWNWVTVKLKHTDVKSLMKHICNGKVSAPTLERKNRKWFLRFAIEDNVTLSNIPLEKQRILAVDLGLNTDAVCVAMDVNGTVYARKFVNFVNDKDRLKHTLNKIKKVQKRYGSHNVTKLWRYAKFHNDELAKKIGNEIVRIADECNCDVIVFEHLNIKGKITGSRKQLLSLWKKNTIQNLVAHKAHKQGKRITHICAVNTSKLAFDGSGEVLRGFDAGFGTNSLCRFQNGKTYNTDLSAAYNIGARYFIREQLKTLPETVRSTVLAKVPELEKRIRCTYATLLQLSCYV